MRERSGLSRRPAWPRTIPAGGFRKGPQGALGRHDLRFRLSPDGSRLAVASRLGIRLYGPFTGAEAALLGGQAIHSVAYSPDGRHLDSTGSPTVRLGPWPAATASRSRAQLRHIRNLLSRCPHLGQAAVMTGCDLDGSAFPANRLRSRLHWRVEETKMQELQSRRGSEQTSTISQLFRGHPSCASRTPLSHPAISGARPGGCRTTRPCPVHARQGLKTRC